MNSKLYAKTLKGAKQWPRGRCLTKKTRGQKSRETVSLRELRLQEPGPQEPRQQKQNRKDHV